MQIVSVVKRFLIRGELRRWYLWEMRLAARELCVMESQLQTMKILEITSAYFLERVFRVTGDLLIFINTPPPPNLPFLSILYPRAVFKFAFSDYLDQYLRFILLKLFIHSGAQLFTLLDEDGHLGQHKSLFFGGGYFPKYFFFFSTKFLFASVRSFRRIFHRLGEKK